ncbi:MAG: hypothetical protein AAF467_03065 [Actinomycetota bacterium]
MAPLALVWSAGSLFLATVLVRGSVPYEELLLDPTTGPGRFWYTGLVSNVGILGWSAAAVTAAWGAWVAGLGDRPLARQALRGGALLSMLLLGDDLFQFHVVVSNALGQGKALFYALYLVLTGAWLVDNRNELRRTRWPLLAAALGALGTSVAIDQISIAGAWRLAAEDSAKFLGILAWALYFATTARDLTRSVFNAAGRPSTVQPPRADEPLGNGLSHPQHRDDNVPVALANMNERGPFPAPPLESPAR